MLNLFLNHRIHWFAGRRDGSINESFLWADWHVKPHWTKLDSRLGHVTMWGRTMPGTKQLILNGCGERYLGNWNYAIDTHMRHILIDLEAALERPILYIILDSEGGACPWANDMPLRSAATSACYPTNTPIP